MARPYRRQDDQLTIIPAIPILKDRLAIIQTEAKRLRLLIRTASDLQRIEDAKRLTLEKMPAPINGDQSQGGRR